MPEKDKKEGTSFALPLLTGTVGFLIAYGIGNSLMQSILSTPTQPTPTESASNVANMVNPIVPTSQMGMPQDFGSPTWVLIILLIGVLGMAIAWYIGKKRKFKILGNE